MTGGASPVTVTCDPGVRVRRSPWQHASECAATDAQSRAATCSFNVTLTGFKLGAVRFDTFGDSLTEGETGRPSFALPFLDPPNAYPTRLQAAFDETYPGQGIVVINRGLSGDSVEATESKMRQFLPIDRPEVALLLTGFNNLTQRVQSRTRRLGRVRERGGQGSRRDTRLPGPNQGSQRRRAHVFLSNLTPPGPTGSNRIDGSAIVQVNGRVRQVAAAEGAVLVDAYAAFVGHESDYVNADGLHLRPAGIPGACRRVLRRQSRRPFRRRRFTGRAEHVRMEILARSRSAAGGAHRRRDLPASHASRTGVHDFGDPLLNAWVCSCTIPVCQLPVASCQLPVISYQLPSCQLPTASCQLSVTRFRLTGNWKLLTSQACQPGVEAGDLTFGRHAGLDPAVVVERRADPGAPHRRRRRTEALRIVVAPVPGPPRRPRRSARR